MDPSRLGAMALAAASVSSPASRGSFALGRCSCIPCAVAGSPAIADKAARAAVGIVVVAAVVVAAAVVGASISVAV